MYFMNDFNIHLRVIKILTDRRKHSLEMYMYLAKTNKCQ